MVHKNSLVVSGAHSVGGTAPRAYHYARAQGFKAGPMGAASLIANTLYLSVSRRHKINATQRVGNALWSASRGAGSRPGDGNVQRELFHLDPLRRAGGPVAGALRALGHRVWHPAGRTDFQRRPVAFSGRSAGGTLFDQDTDPGADGCVAARPASAAQHRLLRRPSAGGLVAGNFRCVLCAGYSLYQPLV